MCDEHKSMATFSYKPWFCIKCSNMVVLLVRRYQLGQQIQHVTQGIIAIQFHFTAAFLLHLQTHKSFTLTSWIRGDTRPSQSQSGISQLI